MRVTPATDAEPCRIASLPHVKDAAGPRPRLGGGATWGAAMNLSILAVAALLAQNPEPTPRADAERPALRILGEAAGGYAAALVLVLPTFLIATSTGCTLSDQCELAASLLTVGFGVAGFGLGTWLGGKLGGGLSAWWPPLLGAVVGTVASMALVVAALQTFGEAARTWALLSYLVLPPAGAVAGAEWSHRVRSARGDRLSVVPLVGAGRAGLAVTWAF